MSPKGMKAACTTASVAFSSSPPAQQVILLLKISTIHRQTTVATLNI
jgi:hypothetical protein